MHPYKQTNKYFQCFINRILTASLGWWNFKIFNEIMLHPLACDINSNEMRNSNSFPTNCDALLTKHYHTAKGFISLTL